MKNSYFLIAAGFAFLLAAGCHPKAPISSGRVSLSPAYPAAGSTIRFTYQADSAFASDTGALTGALLYVVKKTVYALDMKITQTDSVWTGSLTLPDSANAFALRFSKGEKKDMNNGNGFVFPVYNQDHQPAQYALAGVAQFYGNGIGSYVLGLKAKPDTVLTLMDKEFAAYPDSRKTSEIDYLSDLYTAKKDSAAAQIRGGLQKLTTRKDLSQDELMQLYGLYNRMHLQPAADSLKKIIQAKYPENNFALGEMEQHFLQMQHADSMAALLQQYQQQFSTAKAGSVPARVYGFLLSRLAQQYANEGKMDEFKKYAAQITDKSSLANLYNNIAWEWAQKNKELQLDDSLSKASLDLVSAQMGSEEGKPSYLTPGERQKDLGISYGMYADTYAFILAKNGNYKDALSYEEKAMAAYNGNEQADMDERYAQYLEKTGDAAKAKTALEGYFENGKATANMKNQLKELYLKQNGSDKGYGDYFASLEAAAEAKMKAGLAKEMIDQPASVFTLPDLAGNQVALNDLKGKVVVVDFWATWCGPCKASFPGMQQTLEKFKNDSTVRFLFVDTWERTTPDIRLKQVTDFIKQNKYGFHVLLDQSNPKNKDQFQTVSAYGVEGIPTKFIIDKNGNIRFKEVGFNGNTDGLVNKLSAMINMLK